MIHILSEMIHLCPQTRRRSLFFFLGTNIRDRRAKSMHLFLYEPHNGVVFVITHKTHNPDSETLEDVCIVAKNHSSNSALCNGAYTICATHIKIPYPEGSIEAVARLLYALCENASLILQPRDSLWQNEGFARRYRGNNKSIKRDFLIKQFVFV